MIEYTNSQIERVIDEYIHSQRDREILKSRFIDGLTYDKLSELYNMSDRQIKKIVYKAQDILIKHISTY